MSRLIDLDDYRNCYIGMDGEYEKWNIDPNVIAEAQPEIIRCEDCKYRRQNNYGDSWCALPEGLDFDVMPTDFCSKAERRTDGQTVSE